MTRHLHMNNVHPFPTFDRCDFAEPSVPRPDLDELLCEAEYLQGDAFQARAADASHSSLLRVSTKSGIAIAAFAALYFIAEFLR